MIDPVMLEHLVLIIKSKYLEFSLQICILLLPISHLCNFSYYYMSKVENSSIGRAWVAIREDEVVQRLWE